MHTKLVIWMLMYTQDPTSIPYLHTPFVQEIANPVLRRAAWAAKEGEGSHTFITASTITPASSHNACNV